MQRMHANPGNNVLQQAVYETVPDRSEDSVQQFEGRRLWRIHLRNCKARYGMGIKHDSGVMHGPFIVAQQARGLLQDLTRVISPQRVDLAEWSMPQVRHERPLVIKVGSVESRISSSIQMRSMAGREQDSSRTAAVEGGKVAFGEVFAGGPELELALRARKRQMQGLVRVLYAAVLSRAQGGAEKRVKQSPSKSRVYLDVFTVKSTAAGFVSVL